MDLFVRFMIAGTVLNYAIYKPLFKWGMINVVECGCVSGCGSSCVSGYNYSRKCHVSEFISVYKNVTNNRAMAKIIEGIQSEYTSNDPYLLTVAVIVAMVTTYSIVDWVVNGIIPDSISLGDIIDVLNDTPLL